MKNPPLDIHIYPKIFKEMATNIGDDELAKVFAKCLNWWLSSLGHFQRYQNEDAHSAHKEDDQQSNLWELCIQLFADFTLDVITQSPYQAYEEVRDTLPHLKGRLDLTAYSRNIARGQAYLLPCQYQSLEHDTLLNQIIKYVTYLLLMHTQEPQSRNKLEEILFILDEVSDTTITLEDCDRVWLNPLYEDWYMVLEYCRMFLSSSSLTPEEGLFSTFSLLFPMNVIFERLVARLFSEHLGQNAALDFKVFTKEQAYLFNKRKHFTGTTDESVTTNFFRMQPDIVLFKQNQAFMVLDTKYKLLDPRQADMGISQSDVYQLMTYAHTWKCKHIALIYPHQPLKTRETTTYYNISLDNHIQLHVLHFPMIKKTFKKWKEKTDLFYKHILNLE